MRHRSPKKAAEYVQRRRILGRSHGPQPCAHQGCPRIGTEPHEPLTRARGGSITDPDNIAWLCSLCHAEATAEAPWAYEQGLLVHSWDAEQRNAFADSVVQSCMVVGMALTQVVVRFTDEQIANLDAQAIAEGRTRSQMLRKVVEDRFGGPAPDGPSRVARPYRGGAEHHFPDGKLKCSKCGVTTANRDKVACE